MKGLKAYQTVRRPLTSREEIFKKNKPDNKVLSAKLPHKKDNSKDLPSKRDQSTMKTEEHRKTLITIASDSMLNYIEGQKLSNRKRATKVHSFPGATCDDMLDYIRPVLLLQYYSPCWNK